MLILEGKLSCGAWSQAGILPDWALFMGPSAPYQEFDGLNVTSSEPHDACRVRPYTCSNLNHWHSCFDMIQVDEYQAAQSLTLSVQGPVHIGLIELQLRLTSKDLLTIFEIRSRYSFVRLKLVG